MKWLEGWRRCTHATDRWITVISAVGIMGPCLWTLRPQPERMVIIRDVHAHEVEWPLNRDTIMEVDGRLGPVKVEIRDQRVRLLEFNSPRLVGTLTGWIDKPGQLTACVPCAVIVQVKGHPSSNHENSGHQPYDGIAR
ncbi:MAG: NusG domain II-containing protein [Magnetococcales bacterium]|nr:NusG domain II-containing protein [Magnetococcales bacterium]MBF0152021.1 NusG domain II-containing protein [Magnetococcales bacterium]